MINRRFYWGFATALFLVTLVGIVAYNAMKKQAEQQLWVENTYKLINQSEYITQLILNMETGRRGFRSTNDIKYLEPYNNAQPKLAPAVDSFKKNIIANGGKKDIAMRIQADIQRIDSFWKSLSPIPSNTFEHKVDITKNEKIYVDKIRHSIATFKDDTNQLLDERRVESAKALDQAIAIILIGTLLTLIIVIALIQLIIRENKRRSAAELLLKEKYEELNKVNEATMRSNWLLNGFRSINSSLIGNESLSELLKNCLQAMVAYLRLPSAVFYLYDQEKDVLVLNGAISMPGTTRKELKLNEGITGSAAAKKAITVVTDIPDNYWQIESGTGSSKPNTLICVPLWKKNEFIGIIEFGCFSADTQRYTELLKDISDNIAMGIAGAHANDLAAILLGKVQEQKDELESQQEELRQTNEELTHQAEALRASEEELKTQEGELRQINAELEEKTEALETSKMALLAKAAELEISGKYKSEFLANMSHELRTPLNSILILAGLLKENKTANLTAKQTDYARIIHKSGSDLLNLINDILDLSKIEAGKIDFHFEQVKIEEIANDVEQLFSVIAAEKQIEFNVTIDTTTATYFQSDKQRVEQVIKNLLSNAFKFTPEKGKINLRFTGDKNHLTISVTDTGIGIPEEKQKLIFEAFQQADGSTSRRYGGTGLGLSISKELVSKLGGEMRLNSKEGLGSTFTLILPLAMAEAKRLQNIVVPAADTVDKDYDLRNIQQQVVVKDDRQALKTAERSILIVEDDVVFAKLLNDFAHEKGYKTMIALSGDEGLFYAQKYKPSAIILDLGLPVIEGRNILKILKSDKSLKDIPVHVISAEDKTNIENKDIESYSRKPLLNNELDRTFASIETYIKQHYRKILILGSEGSRLRNMFEKLSTEVNLGIVYDIAETKERALEIVKHENSDCIIVDIKNDISNGITILKELQDAATQKVYIITCLEGDISTADEKQLKTYSNSVIREDSMQATERLMDEVALFLNKLEEAGNIVLPDRYAEHSDALLENKKILIADDDMRNVFALTAIFEENGMNVIAAENGKEAIRLLAENSDTDIVLMDIMMPEMDGYTAMSIIRRDKSATRLPIIALTAKAMTGDREKCIEAGASDYITKPIDNNKLLSLIRVWLAGKS